MKDLAIKRSRLVPSSQAKLLRTSSVWHGPGARIDHLPLSLNQTCFSSLLDGDLVHDAFHPATLLLFGEVESSLLFTFAKSTAERESALLIDLSEVLGGVG